MPRTPTTSAAAHIAYVAVDELMKELVAKGVLDKADTDAVWNRVRVKLEASNENADALRATAFVRDVILVPK